MSPQLRLALMAALFIIFVSFGIAVTPYKDDQPLRAYGAQGGVMEAVMYLMNYVARDYMPFSIFLLLVCVFAGAVFESYVSGAWKLEDITKRFKK